MITNIHKVLSSIERHSPFTNNVKIRLVYDEYGGQNKNLFLLLFAESGFLPRIMLNLEN